MLSHNSCSKKEEPPTKTVPVLSTKNATDVTNTSAKVGGIITSNGGASVTERGVCYSTSSNPTVADNTKPSGSGTGTFDCILTGLDPSTKYYFKAFAINSIGIGYGEQKLFTTQGGGGGDLPTVTTSTVSNITETSATSGGNVTDQGSSSVTARGVCWSTFTNPTTSDSYTTNSSGTGSFTSNLTGLTASTSYYVRAYAANSTGTAYGNQQSFTTSGGGGSTFTDPRDGQVYNIVTIGSQIWFAESLNIGTRINGIQNQTNNQTIEKYCYDDNESNCNTYGGLYQWDEMMQYTTAQGSQGICPTGWHIPTHEEWKILEGTVDSQYGVGSPEWNNGGWRGLDAGKKLKSTTGWNSNGNGTNDFGFTALPGGWTDPTIGFHSLGIANSLWTSNETSDYEAMMRGLLDTRNTICRYINLQKTTGFSVRCIKD